MVCFSKNKRNNTKNRSGFTIIELMVTVSIMAIFSTIALTYNRSSEFSMEQYVEQSKIIGAVYKARDLSMSAHSTSATEHICGFGIKIVSSTEITIFKIPLIVGTTCSYVASTGQTFTGMEIYKKVRLNEVVITAPTTNLSLFFVPPDPEVYTNASSFPVTITIHSPKATSNLYVSINKFGQITTNNYK